MKSLVRFGLLLPIVFAMLVATDRRAWGYVDPGSGLLALQSFASVVAAAGYLLRKRVMALFGRKPADPDPKDGAPHVTPNQPR